MGRGLNIDADVDVGLFGRMGSVGGAEQVDMAVMTRIGSGGGDEGAEGSVLSSLDSWKLSSTVLT